MKGDHPIEGVIRSDERFSREASIVRDTGTPGAGELGEQDGSREINRAKKRETRRLRKQYGLNAVVSSGNVGLGAVRGPEDSSGVKVTSRGGTKKIGPGETSGEEDTVLPSGTPSLPGYENWTPSPSARNGGTFRAKAAGRDVAKAAEKALADVVAVPITDVVMAGVMPLDGGGENLAAGVQIDKISGAMQEVVDPARIPSALVEKAVTHLLTHLLTPIAAAVFGPVGPVIAIFVGDFAGELTHQVLDAGRDSAGIQFAESAIELTGAFADARIGRLAESQPFSEYVSSLVGQQIVAIIDKDTSTPASHEAERATGRTPAITAIVAAFEVDIPPSRSGSDSSADSTTTRVRPASLAVLTCIPAAAVARQWKSGSHEYLRLTDGTLLRRRIDGDRPGRWIRVDG